MFKVPEQLQLGIRTACVLTAGEEPLAYCRRYGTKAAERKLTESIKTWCRGNAQWEPIVLDNVPIKGFKFGSSVSRWSTSNKLMEVIDPRGFTLQIPIANLAILIASAQIDAGTITTECVWGFDGSNVILLDINSDYYKDTLAKHAEQEAIQDLRVKVNKKNLVIGQSYERSDGEPYTYIGVKALRVTCKQRSWNGRDTLSYDTPESFHVFGRVFDEEGYNHGNGQYRSAQTNVQFFTAKGLSGWFLTDQTAATVERITEVLNLEREEGEVKWQDAKYYVRSYPRPTDRVLNVQEELDKYSKTKYIHTDSYYADEATPVL